MEWDLQLTIDWNRPDLARSEIFDKYNLDSFKVAAQESEQFQRFKKKTVLLFPASCFLSLQSSEILSVPASVHLTHSLCLCLCLSVCLSVCLSLSLSSQSPATYVKDVLYLGNNQVSQFGLAVRR